MGGRQRCRGDQLDAVVQVAPGDQLRDGETGRFSRSPRARMSGVRSTSPESSTISPIAPTGGSPASRHRSTAASVCPTRSKTPPALARSGSTWPGRIRSDASASRLPDRCGGSIRRGDSGRDSSRGVHAHGVRGPQRVGIVRHHQGQPRDGRPTGSASGRRDNPRCAAPSTRPIPMRRWPRPRWRLLRSRDRGCRGPGRDARRRAERCRNARELSHGSPPALRRARGGRGGRRRTCPGCRPRG